MSEEKTHVINSMGGKIEVPNGRHSYPSKEIMDSKYYKGNIKKNDVSFLISQYVKSK